MNLYLTVKLEPWYLGLIDIARDYLRQEVDRGTISYKDAGASMAYTIEAGSKLGMIVK